MQCADIDGRTRSTSLVPEYEIVMPRQRAVPGCYFLLLLLAPLSGCSSLGLSLWPSQFPLLSQTKKFAAQSRGPKLLANELDKSPIIDYFVEPGDRVSIEPVELDSDLRMTGDQQVQVDGSIDLGPYGRLRVAGLTVEEIENAITERIKDADGKTEVVNVQLIETNAAKVYVLGAVGSPGAYPMQGNELVLDAILLAGGLTSTASPCDIILVRPTPPCACRVVLPVCYRQITQLGDVSTNYQLQPGDRIVVGSRTLCEELAVWRQTKPCPACGQSRCAERQPENANYTNRFMRMLQPFRRPDSVPEEVDESHEFKSEFPSLPAEQGDEDIFLEPSESNQGDPRGSRPNSDYSVVPARDFNL